MKSKPGKTIYWILTLLVAVPFLGSGVAYVFGAPAVVAGMERLGYPPYFIPFLGVAKLLAVLAIVVGIFPRIKEWAYAGLVFNVIGALYSHFRANQRNEALIPAIMLVLIVASYLNWRKRADIAPMA
jgi:uncharacterized membrane protein YphA (DoxX/SURF4 family)